MASPICRATTRACRKTFPSSARRFPAISAGRSPMPARQRPACRHRGQDPEQQRIAQEQEAARTSHLFATTNVAQVAPAAVPAPAGGQAVAPAAGSADLTSQDHKLAFLNGNVDRRTVSPDRDRSARQSLRPAGRRRDPRGADHRTAFRPARPGHRSGHRGCLRQPDRTGSPDPARRAPGRPVRRPDRLRAVAGAAGLEPPDHAERAVDRAGAPARRRRRKAMPVWRTRSTITGACCSRPRSSRPS